MTNGIQKYEPNGLDAMLRTASALRSAGGMIPQHLRSEGEILAVIMAGQELGLGPMASLRSLFLVKGKVGLSYDAMVGLLRKAGYRVEWKETTNTRAVLVLTHPDGSTHTETWDEERATTAGLWKSDMWRKYPDTMLRARCVSSAARAFAGDVLAGCYSTDELREVSNGRVQAQEVDGEVVVQVVDTRGANESHGYHNPEHVEAKDRARVIADGFVAKHATDLEECAQRAAAELDEAGDDEDEVAAIRAGHEQAIRRWVHEHGREYLTACNAHPSCGSAKSKIFGRLRRWAMDAGLPQTLPGELIAALADEMRQEQEAAQ